MANIFLKKGDSSVEVPESDASSIAVWVAAGWTYLGTAADVLAQDKIVVTDLQVKGKILLGDIESSNSFILTPTGGQLYVEGCSGGNYTAEYAFVNSGALKTVLVSGIQGTTGLVGTTGVQGITGLQGVTGLIGSTGLVGTTGLQGAQGATGVQGDTGAQGVTGIQGTTGA